MMISSLIDIAPLSWKALGTTILCGVLVGFERQLRGKPVGIRTSALIVMGTYLFIAISTHAANEASDPSRIIGQVVTGIGFLGAGVMMAREGTVVGVTSAATIWVLAAIGVCIALLDELIAIKLSALVVGILYGVDLLEAYSTKLTRGVHAKLHQWRKNGK
ncbi:MAG: putative Mg2+ transporter-C (MgtC) family protein [Pseudohongiellaceae bacterium]|jgi:putative Mg2+ transporter-C (MgtC) family protein|nr:MgtC/SapB family protein [Pseudomonadota bacterium]MDA1291980.1 MgtC/SapB family protein [Pseudomonadota bacterium]